MSNSSPFLALPAGSCTGSSGSSSFSSLFAGDSQYSNSTDITPPRSPVIEEPKPTQLMSFVADSTHRRVSPPKLNPLPKAKENEQVLCLDDETTPKTPIQSPKTGIFPFSPPPYIQLQEDATGYESDSEGENGLRSRPHRNRRAQANPSSVPARMRGVSTPIIGAAGEDPSYPNSDNHSNPTICRQNRPPMLDLTVIPPRGNKLALGKAAIGLGLGLPSNHLMQISRASTAPMLMSPPISRASNANLLPCRPFPPPGPLHTGQMQNPRLQPTVILDSPSPMDMLPSRFSYFQSPNCPSPQRSFQIPRSPLRDAFPETRLGFQGTSVSGMPSPTELYSSLAFDTVYPRTPFASPEARAYPSFTATGGNAEGANRVI
jgi:hypothetical protein